MHRAIVVRSSRNHRAIIVQSSYNGCATISRWSHDKCTMVMRQPVKKKVLVCHTIVTQLYSNAHSHWIVKSKYINYRHNKMADEGKNARLANSQPMRWMCCCSASNFSSCRICSTRYSYFPFGLNRKFRLDRSIALLRWLWRTISLSNYRHGLEIGTTLVVRFLWSDIK